jgi:ABC-type amino acid transport substrate-binding protein
VNILTQNKKMAVARVIGIAMIWTFTLFPSESFAKADNGKPTKLIVGTMDAAPFAMKTADGVWEGLSVDLWQKIASVLGVQYEYKQYDTIGAYLDAVEKGKLDVVIALAVTEKREISFEFSQTYYRSGYAIAVSVDSVGRGWFGFAGRRDISIIFKVIGLLVLMWLAAGAAVWVFESRRNREMFGGGPIKGLWQAVWWAAVTMTTVGYGDKAPETLGGRVVAIVWMLASVVLISSFTASISASLTAEKLTGKVRGMQDLPHVRVGSVTRSSALKWLAEHGITPVPFPAKRDGLQAIVDNKIDAFVYDELVLKHLIKTDFPGRAYVLAGTFDHYFVIMGMPDGSPLREPINRALLQIMERSEWDRLVERYIGSSY